MSGFFTKKETESTSRADGKVYSCVGCGLYKNCKSPKMQPTGGFAKGILNIGIRPSSIDDRAGSPFNGKAGELLRSEYNRLGIDLEKDCLNMNVISCAPPDGRLPSSYELDSCRRFILAAIKNYAPKIIVLFGDGPVYSVIGHRWQNDLGTIIKWRGWTIPDQDFKAWVCPTYAPENIEHSKNPVDLVIWRQDLKRIAELSKDPKLREHILPKIRIISDLRALSKISGAIAFDYETTGLKPHANGHKIICASVATDENFAYAFMFPESKAERQPFIDLLENKKIQKFVQNMKFEYIWSWTRLDTEVVGWHWDTMLASHQLDNRPMVTGLKFQVYVQFGVVDYASEVNPYLKAVDDSNANSINRIEELLQRPGGKEQLLHYCALDSIYEYRLAMLQMPQIVDDPVKYEAYQLFHKGILSLARAERQGLRIDSEYIQSKTLHLTRRIERLEKTFKQSEFFKQWQRSVNGNININSITQLGTYLYGVKQITPKKTTVTGKGSTDEEALQALNIPELDILFEKNKLKKIRDTYLKAFEREQVDGFLHPFFNLHLVQTYRSSSNNPNFQNIPKRDFEAMQTCRKSIYPRKGNQLLELDFSQLEVSIAACYHKDKTMIHYLNNPKSDMHGDMASQIFCIPNFDKNIASHNELRKATKNGFVFPQFYGDYYKNCAEGIASKWIGLPTGKWQPGMGMKMEKGTISDHLIANGIKSLNDFTEHIKKIEYDFWTNRFREYAQWKERHYARYKKTGEVQMKTGFICKGSMSKNDVINYPVQGAAFHCLLWSFIRLEEVLLEKELQTKIVGQIHDAMVLDVFPPELEEVYAIAKHITCVELPATWKWINIPLNIDAEICPVDGSWADKCHYTPKQ